jgi:uncharacterized membrane protein YgdD (TMEM256/DUF423 family)
MLQKFCLLAGSVLGALTVMIGAFGAHALSATLEANKRVPTFETAVKYQMYHTLALLSLGILMFWVQHSAFNVAAICFLAGIFVFSGSLYILSLTGITWLGAVTPIGGLLMIVGWASLFYGLLRAL